MFKVISNLKNSFVVKKKNSEILISKAFDFSSDVDRKYHTCE